MRLRLFGLALSGLVGLSLASGLGAALAGPMEPPGTHYEVHVGDLPPVNQKESSFNGARKVARRPNQSLLVPAGFHANIFAGGLDFPRWLAVAPNGDVFVSEPNAGKVMVLRDLNGDGTADLTREFARGFDRPHGIAFHGGFVYIADLKAIWRLPYKNGQLRAGERMPITRPGALGRAGNHWTRDIAIPPDAKSVYVAIGSRTNLSEEPSPQATVQKIMLDGSGQTTFASGLRNPVGIAFYPGTDDLYVTVNERDTYGNDLVPDYLTRVRAGDFFGWPYAYIGPHPDPKFGKLRPDLVKKTKIPDLLFRSHSAPLGLVFYESTQFPASYRGDAFVALHGSWNRSPPSGYKVVHVPFKDGRPVGGYDTFASGFWVKGKDHAQVIGRPAGLAVAGDGSLLIADDTGDVIWRVSYSGQK
jgi:glucose/arabinose dehydrogenase